MFEPTKEQIELLAQLNATGQAPIGAGNTPKDSAEFTRWVEQARLGDEAAAARIRAVPMDWINAQKPR